MSIMVVSNVKSMKMERSEHSRCNLDMEATGLVEGWDVEMVVGGTEGKGGIKEDIQVLTVSTGNVVLPFLEPETIVKWMNLELGSITSCLGCQNNFFTGVYLLACSQQFILEKSHLSKSQFK